MGRLRSWIRIAANFLAFPFLYPGHKAYPTFREHFSIADELPERADLVIALGCSLQPDGRASHPTRAIAERAAEIYKQAKAGKIVLSGGNPVNGISEGEALRRVLEKTGIPAGDLILDELPQSGYVGTLAQVQSIGKIFERLGPGKVVLVVQPQQLPRAFWLFRRIFPHIQFYTANPKEEYDRQSTQARMHSAWRFRLWNMVAWSGLWRQAQK